MRANRLFRYGDDRISRVPVRSSRCMPCSHQTPVGPEPQAIRRPQCCLPLVTQRRLPRICDFGAQSHGLHLRRLRFAPAATRTPRKTHFRAVASLTRAGLDPQDLFERSPKRLISRHLFPLPRALLGARHVHKYPVVGLHAPCYCQPCPSNGHDNSTHVNVAPYAM
jgi:hypothetical protein